MPMNPVHVDVDRFGIALARDSKERARHEKIIPGYNNLQQLSWLREGLRRAQSVGRVVTPDGLGTGWLISDELLITNNHVIWEQPSPKSCWIEFDYEVDWTGVPLTVERYEIDQLLKTDRELDYTIISVKGRPGEKYGHTNIRDARVPQLNSSATHYPVIIQHPRGEFKQISLTDNTLVTMDDTLVWYTTDTEPGSSGSPVYDQLWRPFALHHAGGPKRLADGRVVLLNEGVILARVVEHAKDVLGGTELLKSVVADLLQSGCFDPKAKTVDVEWYMSNPRLHNAIKTEARGDREIGPLLAAAAGVAAGAAAAHWAHRTSKESKEDATLPTEIVLSQSLKLKMPEPDERSQAGVFARIYDQLKSGALTRISDPLTHEHLKKLAGEAKHHEVAPLAAAFLAGVAAGAAAYRAGMK